MAHLHFLGRSPFCQTADPPTRPDTCKKAKLGRFAHGVVCWSRPAPRPLPRHPLNLSDEETVMTPSSQGQTRTITAFFDNRTDAEEAVQRLHSAGISKDAVRMMAGYQGQPERDVNASENTEGMGFWEALKDLFLPEEDRHTYAE